MSIGRFVVPWCLKLQFILLHLLFFRMLQAFANVKTRKVGSTMKDGDLHEKLYLKDAQQKDLIFRLDKDARFLEEHQIMDYSVRVHTKSGCFRD